MLDLLIYSGYNNRWKENLIIFHEFPIILLHSSHSAAV